MGTMYKVQTTLLQNLHPDKSNLDPPLTQNPAQTRLPSSHNLQTPPSTLSLTPTAMFAHRKQPNRKDGQRSLEVRGVMAPWLQEGVEE